MENWKLTNLGDVANFVRGPFGGSLKKEFFVDEGYAVYEQQHAIRNQFHSVRYFIDENKFKEMKRFELHENDIIMSCSGTMGKVAIVPNNIQKGIINQALLKISPSNKLDSKFLENYMKSVTFLNYLNAEVKGVAIKNVASVKDLKQIPILLPPLTEQQAIVEKLDFAFDAIEKAKANIEKNIENAKELFQSKLNAIFSQKGESWEEIEIGKLCVLKRGHNPPKSNFIYEPKDGYVRFYQIRDGSSDKFAVYVPDTPQLQRVEPNDILIVAYRHVGRAFRGVTGCFNVALCKVSNRDRSVLNDDYLFYIIPTNFVRGELLKQSERSLIPSMSVEHLKIIKIPVPTLDIQNEIVKQLDQLKLQTNLLQEKYIHKLANLEELKKSILEKAFKGELV
mgnify:CR=1 FL=1